jgi:hypothetical protein
MQQMVNGNKSANPVSGHFTKPEHLDIQVQLDEHGILQIKQPLY